MCAVQSEARLETDRLLLRRPRRADAPWIAAAGGDWEIARMTSRMPHPYGLSDAEDFLDHLDPLEDQVFLIEHKARGPVGMLGLHAAQPQWSETGCGIGPELGYWIARDAWSQGYASEAVEGVLEWARRDWGRRAVAAGHFADNPASARVLVKAGFLYTGEVQSRPSRARGGVAPTRMMVWLA